GRQAVGRGAGQGQRDQPHPGGGEAAQAVDAAWSGVALAVEDQAVGGLVVEEVAQGGVLKPQQKSAIGGGKEPCRPWHGGAPWRRDGAASAPARSTVGPGSVSRRRKWTREAWRVGREWPGGRDLRPGGVSSWSGWIALG